VSSERICGCHWPERPTNDGPAELAVWTQMALALSKRYYHSSAIGYLVDAREGMVRIVHALAFCRIYGRRSFSVHFVPIVSYFRSELTLLGPGIARIFRALALARIHGWTVLFYSICVDHYLTNVGDCRTTAANKYFTC
jgi:hypothetical protein